MSRNVKKRSGHSYFSAIKIFFKYYLAPVSSGDENMSSSLYSVLWGQKTWWSDVHSISYVICFKSVTSDKLFLSFQVQLGNYVLESLPVFTAPLSWLLICIIGQVDIQYIGTAILKFENKYCIYMEMCMWEVDIFWILWVKCQLAYQEAKCFITPLSFYIFIKTICHNCVGMMNIIGQIYQKLNFFTLAHIFVHT